MADGSLGDARRDRLGRRAATTSTSWLSAVVERGGDRQGAQVDDARQGPRPRRPRSPRPRWRSPRRAAGRSPSCPPCGRAGSWRRARCRAASGRYSALAAMMLAIAVPVPRQSVSPRPFPTVTSAPTAIRPLSCSSLPSTPESTTATIDAVAPADVPGALRGHPQLGPVRAAAGRRPAVHRDAWSLPAPADETGWRWGSGRGAGRATGRPGGAAAPGGCRWSASAAGSCPYFTPSPTASQGSTRYQPGLSRAGSVRLSPSGWTRPAFRL